MVVVDEPALIAAVHTASFPYERPTERRPVTDGLVGRGPAIQRCRSSRCGCRGVIDVQAPDAGEVFIPAPRRVCLFEIRDEIVEPVDPQRWVCFASWPEVLLHPEMYLDSPGSEPPAAAGGEGLWLREDSEAEYVAVERLCLALAIGGHGELDVVEGRYADAHVMNRATARLSGRARRSPPAAR
jgi:hypothetical protein